MSEEQYLCANDEMLRQLLLGMLPREQAACLEDHVLGCRHCGKRLAGIEAEDTLVEAAHAQSTRRDGDDEQLQRLVDRLCRLPMASMGPAGGQPPAVDGLDGLRRFLAPAMAPDELGRMDSYRVLKVLGSGGMGIVMEAEDTQLGRRVALKVMRPVLAANRSARTRFLREARAAAAIQHDNVVTIYQVGEHDGLPYLAMQLLEGETLARRLQRHAKLQPAEAINIGHQLAAGLAAAHARGLVHRDIKPDNIWLEAPSGRVKILDFGLAHAAGDASRLTQSGVITGTPAYMAPEQVECREADPRADLFSLGCVLYEMAAGQIAFRRATVAATILAVAHQTPPPPWKLDPEISRPFSDLVMKLLEKDPARRFPDTAAVLAALAACERPPARGGGGRRAPIIAITLLAAFLGVVGAVLVYLKTDAGTLVLEVDRSDVRVTIDGDDIKLRSPRDRIEVRVGKHGLAVRKDGFSTFTQSFEIVRGGKVEIAARLEPNRAASGEGPPQAPPATLPPPAQPSAPPAKATGPSVETPVADWPQPSLPDEPIELRLPSRFTQFCTGSSGRYLIFYCRDAGKMLIVDVPTAHIARMLDFSGEDLRIAAGNEKLLVISPARKLMHRYSLKTFQREKSVSLPFDAPVQIALMGSASTGPLGLWCGGSLMLWDVDEMRPFTAEGDLLGGSGQYGFGLRVSANGQTFAGWTSGLTGQPFNVMTLRGHTASIASTEGFSVNGRWLQPNPDASLIFRSGGMYTTDLRPIAVGSLDGAVLLPTEDRRFFLAIRPQDHGSQITICTTADRRPVATVDHLESVTGDTVSTNWGHWNAESRVHYLPRAGCLAVVPDGNDRVLIRGFSLHEALARNGDDYLIVTSAPPIRVRPGPFRYQVEVLSEKPGIRFRLEGGPDGMAVSDAGLVAWDVPATMAAVPTSVVIAISNSAGKEIFHAFELLPEADAGGNNRK